MFVDKICFLMTYNYTEYFFCPYADNVVGIGLKIKGNEVVFPVLILRFIKIQFVIIVEEIFEKYLSALMRIL
jgi:hypothetical protein